jgi:hypothetical protein
MVELANVIIWVLGLVSLGGVFLFFDVNRLDVFIPPETEDSEEELPDIEDKPKDTALGVQVESSDADMAMFSFNDMVSETFALKDAEKMSDLIHNSDRMRLEEIS